MVFPLSTYFHSGLKSGVIGKGGIDDVGLFVLPMYLENFAKTALVVFFQTEMPDVGNPNSKDKRDHTRPVDREHCANYLIIQNPFSHVIKGCAG